MPGYKLTAEQSRAISRRLREAREAKGLTQDEIARMLGVSKQLVSHLENSRSELTVPTGIRLAKEFGVSIEWLLTGSGRGPGSDGWSSAGSQDSLARTTIEERLARLEQEMASLRKLIEMRSASDTHR